MGVFPTKKFRPSSASSTIGATYRRHLAKHPFILFGLPFIGTIVAGSFFLTPATALRYEKYDRKIKRLSEDDALGLKADRRKVDLNEEYYVRTLHSRREACRLTPRSVWRQRISIAGSRSGWSVLRALIMMGSCDCISIEDVREASRSSYIECRTHLEGTRRHARPPW